MKVINSQKRKVNTQKIYELGIDVNSKIVVFHGLRFLHLCIELLSHSWEVIEMNEGYGLGARSEEGLEPFQR